MLWKAQDTRASVAGPSRVVRPAPLFIVVVVVVGVGGGGGGVCVCACVVVVVVVVVVVARTGRVSASMRKPPHGPHDVRLRPRQAKAVASLPWDGGRVRRARARRGRQVSAGAHLGNGRCPAARSGGAVWQLWPMTRMRCKRGAAPHSWMQPESARPLPALRAHCSKLHLPNQ